MTTITVTTHYGEDVYEHVKRWKWTDEHRSLKIMVQNGVVEEKVAEYPSSSVIKVEKEREE